MDGNFVLQGVPTKGNLVFSFVGYKTVKAAIKNGQIYNIKLQEDTKVLDEVVVTAQGLNRKQKALGYSTQKVAGEDLTISRQTDLGNAMAGKVSGARL